MNIKRIAHCTLFSITLLAFSPSAISGDVHNVQEFDVNGMSLGDDAEQVINALIKFYSISRDDLEIERSSSAKGEPIEYVDYLAEGFKVKTFLTPIGGFKGKFDSDAPRYLADLNIRWKDKIENYEEFVEKAIEKYGTPTFVQDRSPPNYAWCTKLDTDKTSCDFTLPRLFITEDYIDIQAAQELIR